MATHKEITNYDGIYFITFTNAKWLPLFHLANAYDVVYTWFDYLKDRGHFIIAYVIMPNHLHVIIGFRLTQGQSINMIIGSAKRMMAYQIVKRIKDGNNKELLLRLKSSVSRTSKAKGKRHEIFEPSFDWKECISTRFIEQKIEYIHQNPCQPKWNLVSHPADYMHSSAHYYSTGTNGHYVVTSYSAMDDIDLTKPFAED